MKMFAAVLKVVNVQRACLPAKRFNYKIDVLFSLI